MWTSQMTSSKSDRIRKRKKKRAREFLWSWKIKSRMIRWKRMRMKEATCFLQAICLWILSSISLAEVQAHVMIKGSKCLLGCQAPCMAILLSWIHLTCLTGQVPMASWALCLPFLIPLWFHILTCLQEVAPLLMACHTTPWMISWQPLTSTNSPMDLPLSCTLLTCTSTTLTLPSRIM